MIDYVKWGDTMLKSGKADTFGKRMYWRRTRLNMSLSDLARFVKIQVFILSDIEKDTESEEFRLLSKNYIKANDARKMINDTLALLELKHQIKTNP